MEVDSPTKRREVETQEEELDLEDEEEFEFIGQEGNEEDLKFDTIVGQLEEIIMDEEFINMQNQFMNEHCDIFENTEENKFAYTAVFEKYTSLIERYIDERLTRQVEGFSMDEFLQELEERGEEEVCGDVFDMLLSFADFATFKELILSYKESKMGRAKKSEVEEEQEEEPTTPREDSPYSNLRVETSPSSAMSGPRSPLKVNRSVLHMEL